MISERLLRKWRKEALITCDAAYSRNPMAKEDDVILTRSGTKDCCNRILRLTQELLDQHLLRRKS